MTVSPQADPGTPPPDGPSTAEPSTATPSAATSTAAPSPAAASLADPSRAGSPAAPPAPAGLRALGPNWYAAVMGTAIIASAGEALPLQLPRPALVAVWVLAAAMLVALLVARAGHWARHGDQARGHLLDPAVAPFYGCLSMALLAVGGGALALSVPGAVGLDMALWTAGTAVGLLATVAVPYLMSTRHSIEPGTADPVWLLPVVAPMVAAALGPPLAAHLPAGQARLTMLMGCYALFGMSLLATLLILPLVFSRLIHHGALPLPMTPTLFLVLGPLGQSTTALGNLADSSPGTFGAASVLYGVPVMGFALLWLALSSAMVVRAVRRGMGFALTWWAFTFPVGTCVTGAAALERHTGLHAFGWLSVALYAVLVVAWLAAAVRTAGGLFSGALLAAPPR
ncbi:TDT family transporter [Streptomyces sp. NBC_01775]|uniref:TDT family transporter n=1 Tax=Streptomyces sp. NBC_01775 TaxID=2975939 RepID=UPI002DD7A8CF|nr:TDT family transporter [Streptomyces sp. NBC_01775]WSB80609.1 TDT family transporter [Streptomyces sp. NBC_01775]